MAWHGVLSGIAIGVLATIVALKPLIKVVKGYPVISINRKARTLVSSFASLLDLESRSTIEFLLSFVESLTEHTIGSKFLMLRYWIRQVKSIEQDNKRRIALRAERTSCLRSV